jgi:hypothetical protein
MDHPSTTMPVPLHTELGYFLCVDVSVRDFVVHAHVCRREGPRPRPLLRIDRVESLLGALGRAQTWQKLEWSEQL